MGFITSNYRNAYEPFSAAFKTRKDGKTIRKHEKIEGKQQEKGGNDGVLIYHSYEKTRKFEKAFSFTHYSDLVCRKLVLVKFDNFP